MKYKEEELFLPVKNFFENKGFSVKGEVKNCDIVALKDDITVICELKTAFNLKLVYQVMDRKTISENVYAVIPRPEKGQNTKDFKNMVKLLKLLNVGLITVALDSPIKIVEVIIEPFEGKSYKNKKKQSLLKKEFSERNMDLNSGGINKRRILTAYMEKSINVLCTLYKLETSSPKDIKSICNEEKTGNILQNNVYGWFERVKKGTYRVSEKGKEFINSDEYREVKEYYRNIINDK